jgi:hypothetical protein
MQLFRHCRVDVNITHWYKLVQVLGFENARTSLDFPFKFMPFLLLQNLRTNHSFDSIDQLPKMFKTRLATKLSSGNALKTLLSRLISRDREQVLLA